LLHFIPGNNFTLLCHDSRHRISLEVCENVYIYARHRTELLDWFHLFDDGRDARTIEIFHR
jgi:hypothetical protein